MMDRDEIETIIDDYNLDEIHIGCLGSHSALEVAYGAHAIGLKTVVVCQRGREKTYTRYFANLFDEILVLEKFNEICNPEIIDRLRELNTIFVPNRSFSVYVGYDNIEKKFLIPLFGTRSLLRAEERDTPKGQYYLLEKSGLRYPKLFTSPDEIDRLVMVKLPHAKRHVERGFFTVASSEEFDTKSKALIAEGIIKKEDLREARIEEFVIGSLFNLDYFYGPATGETEFLGAEQRIESDIEGFLHMTAAEQAAISMTPHIIPVGHRGVTVRESLLEKVFVLGEKFRATTEKAFPPGIIGPFALQGVFDKDTEFWTFDVSLRVPGAPILLTTSPYMLYKHGTQFSVGRRIAMEVQTAIAQNKLIKCLT
ncbi:MAG: formate--phosphoribosylaminoimidazolecarboxamide ligase family protein [Candidatus Heimdallarchaeota archaeon]